MIPSIETLKAKLRISAHRIASVRNESKVKVSVIIVFTGLLWLGVFKLVSFLCQRLILYTGSEAGIEFIGYLLSTFTVLIFTFLVFSNVLVAYSTLYKSRETIFLFNKPIDYKKIFLMRFFESILFTSWALAFLGIPVLVPLGIALKAPIYFYPALVLYFIPFIVIAGSVGCIVTMVLVRIFPGQKTKVLFGVGAIVVTLFVIYLKNIFQSTRVEEGILLINFLQELSSTRSEYLPSFWLSSGIMSIAVKDALVALKFLLFLLFAALFMLYGAYCISGLLYYQGWTRLLGQDVLRIKNPQKSPFRFLKVLDGILENPTRALFVKDLKLFWRDPTQWTQFVIFFGVIGIYYTYLGSISYYKNLGVMKNYIGFFNVGFVSLILATLTSRFVFPLISLEGRRFWILGLAPLSYKKLLWQKFWLSVVSTSIFTVSLILFSGLMLRLGAADIVLSLYLIIVHVLTLSGLAVGLGALYPNFNEDNVSRIVSGLGGTLNFLISSLYVFIIILLQIKYFQYYILNTFGLMQLAFGREQ